METPSHARNPARQRAILACMLVVSLGVMLAAGLAGPVSVPLSELPGALAALVRGAGGGMASTLLDLRLGRAASAFAVGAALSLAGVLMQSLLRNPLADPYVLGISSGSAVGALAALLLGGAIWSVDAGALGGAAAIALSLYALARRDLDGHQQRDLAGDSSTLLLTGVILSAGCMALVTLMLSVAPESQLRGMVFWLVGDLSGAGWSALPWAVLAAAVLHLARRARDINAMALHAGEAVVLGVDVRRLRRTLFAWAGVLTASAVATAGAIGFVGLVVPHVVRHAFGPDHRIVLPASVLGGGAFLVLADTLARTVLSPQQLPVGVVTALVGVPLFLVQLHQLGARK